MGNNFVKNKEKVHLEVHGRTSTQRIHRVTVNIQHSKVIENKGLLHV